MARAKHPFGPYEADPLGAIVSSTINNSNERHDPDHLKPQYFNPESVLQKSGHGSYVDLPNGQTYLFHLTSRPFVPELCCTLGRETAIQKMIWTSDGWLRMADGSALAKVEVEEPNLPAVPLPSPDNADDFNHLELNNYYYAPRLMPNTFANTKERSGFVRIRGHESQASLNKVSLLARKLTSVYASITTAMDFHPEVYQHSAGLIVYYDNQNYVFLRKYYSQSLQGSAIALIHLENGEKNEMLSTRVKVDDEKELVLRVNFRGRKFSFEWGYKEPGDHIKSKVGALTAIGQEFDTYKFSDEYCKFGEFTGTFVGITCSDSLFHKKHADFDFFDYCADEAQSVH